MPRREMVLKAQPPLAFILVLLAQVIFAADVQPPAQSPEKGSESRSQTTPENPSGSGVPSVPPSNIDPGIERRPGTVPHPRSAVPPPNVDPNMAINPETSPPGAGGKKPRGGQKPKAEPPSQ